MATTELTADLEAGYESFLSARPEALVWQSLGFRDVLLEVLDCEPRYLVEQTNRKVSGVMPLMEKDGILNSLPYFGSMGGPVGGGRGLRMAYSERVEEARAGTVISNPFASHPVRFNQLVRREAQWSPLPAPRLDSPEMRKPRLDLNRAQRAGVEVVNDPGAMPGFVTIHLQNMKAVGAPPRTPGFFAAVEKHLDYDLWIGAIRGKVAAGLLVLHYSQTTEYAVPAIVDRYRPDNPLAPLIWRAMHEASLRGSTRMNWGGSTTAGEGVAKFKRKWGGRDVMYRYYCQVNDRSLVGMTPSDVLRRWPGFFVVPFDAKAVDEASKLKLFGDR